MGLAFPMVPAEGVEAVGCQTAFAAGLDFEAVITIGVQRSNAQWTHHQFRIHSI
jgi:hypothetical protein